MLVEEEACSSREDKREQRYAKIAKRGFGVQWSLSFRAVYLSYGLADFVD